MSDISLTPTCSFETLLGPAVESVNPVTQKKFGLGFVKNPIFRNTQKSTIIQNPIPVEPINQLYFIF